MKPKHKDKLRYTPKPRNGAPRRKDGIYYEDYCCSTCFWDWGWTWADGFGNFSHNCTQDNYKGKLKKYWQPSKIDFEEKIANAVGARVEDNQVKENKQ